MPTSDLSWLVDLRAAARRRPGPDQFDNERRLTRAIGAALQGQKARALKLGRFVAWRLNPPQPTPRELKRMAQKAAGDLVAPTTRPQET